MAPSSGKADPHLEHTSIPVKMNHCPHLECKGVQSGWSVCKDSPASGAQIGQAGKWDVSSVSFGEWEPIRWASHPRHQGYSAYVPIVPKVGQPVAVWLTSTVQVIFFSASSMKVVSQWETSSDTKTFKLHAHSHRSFTCL